MLSGKKRIAKALVYCPVTAIPKTSGMYRTGNRVISPLMSVAGIVNWGKRRYRFATSRISVQVGADFRLLFSVDQTRLIMLSDAREKPTT